MQFPSSVPVPAEVVEIASRLEEAGHEAWCVGGALRDALLDIPHSDFDIATSALPEEVQALFRRTVPVGLKFGTVGVLDGRRRLHEVTTFRRDVSTDGRKAVVAYGITLEEDLARRDFTINAIAYHPIRHEWRDPFAGAIDLARKRVRAVGNATERFQEDYLRILRCARFAARLKFTVVQETWQAAVANAPGLANLSAERVRDEWYKSLETSESLERLAGLWDKIGAAAVWIPELRTPDERNEIDVLHGVRDRDISRDPVLLTVLLCHRPSEVLTRFKASRAEINRALALEKHPAGPAGNDPVSVRRWMAQVEECSRDLMELSRLRSGDWPPWRSMVESIRSRGDATRIKDLAVTGEDLIGLGISPGPRLGQMLTMLLDHVIEDPRLNTRDGLLSLAREHS
ncbi:MAG: CCA tRNA nucleotidyltransferase [Gemmatimonadota bacterium]